MRLVKGLRSELGAAGVLTGNDSAPMLNDLRGVFRGEALAVVRPDSTAEVSCVVRACKSAGVSIVPQGGNTGMSGGAVPAASMPVASGPAAPGPLIVLSLARMNRITSVNPDRWTITAEAGVTIQALQEAAARLNRQFAPDWGARGTATVGGAVSTDAGGNNVMRYGNLRDNVMGLEVVLADGRVWNGLRALRKDSSGYDLKQLFIGAEGTLGVVTRAVLKLHPAAPFVQSALAAVTELDHLMTLLELAQHHGGGTVTAFELIPEVGLSRVCERFGLARPLPPREDFYVLAKLAGTKPVTDLLSSFLDDAAQRGCISDAVIAVTPQQEARLWAIRDELPPSGLWSDLQVHGVKLDTAVPLDLIGTYHDTVRQITAEVAPGALTYGFGHLGDGNLHMMVLPTTEAQVAPFLAVRDELEARLDEAVFALGGTLSAEHGIGRLLRTRIGPQKPKLEWELMRAVKRLFDPDNIMNPGSTLPPDTRSTAVASA